MEKDDIIGRLSASENELRRVQQEIGRGLKWGALADARRLKVLIGREHQLEFAIDSLKFLLQTGSKCRALHATGGRDGLSD